jgi:conjugal transfer ATP-binding protein TraC
MQHDLYALGISSTKSTNNAVHMSPMVSEWRGSKNPVLLFGGKRGQVTGLDLFDNTEGNPSAAIIGTPGSGKSVFLNEIAWSYLGTGAKVWMMDLGKSFERLCKMAKGQMIDLKTGCGININPFSSVIEKDFADDLAMLTSIVSKMAAPFGALDPFQYAALTNAITRAWNEHKNEMTVTHLRDIFRPGKLNESDPHDRRLTDLAVMLEPYSEGGMYAEFFDGPSTIDFSNNFIVIEAESLKRSPALHRVVLMSLLFRITSEMYFTRNRRKLLMIDELIQQLGDDDDPVLARIIEEAARRARKYGGALITATHQIEDYHASPALLTAFTLSDAVFVFRQKKESVELLSRSGKLSMDENKKRMLQSLRLEKGAYAEIYAYTQMGEGVLRSVIDPYSLLMFSNRIEDNAPIDVLTDQGMELDEAFHTILRDRGIIPMEQQYEP